MIKTDPWPILALGTLLLAVSTGPSLADDWPAWRGTQRDGICRETGLLKKWPADGPKLAWKVADVGEGYSGPAIVGRRLYTMGNVDGQECVLALDAADGKRIWTTPIGPVEYDGFSPGTRCTPTVDGGRLYVVGASGKLACLDTDDGKIRFTKSFVTDLGGAVPRWGYAESVLIDGKLLLCTPGGERATVAALDKLTGRTVWTSPVGDPANYSSIMKMTIDDVPQYIQFVREGLIGVAAADGKLLWRYRAPGYTKYGGINISTVVTSGRSVFAASGYGVGGGLVRVQKTAEGFAAKEVYFTKEMKNHHGGMILLDGHLYGCNDPGILTCLEFATGKVKWRDRSSGKCSLLAADGMLYCRSETGPISLVEATPEAFRLHGRFDQPHRSDQKSWPHPVIANGMLYIRDQQVLLCYDVRSPHTPHQARN